MSLFYMFSHVLLLNGSEEDPQLFCNTCISQKQIAYNIKKKHEGYHLNVPAITNMYVLFRCKHDCIVFNKGKLKSHVLI